MVEAAGAHDRCRDGLLPRPCAPPRPGQPFGRCPVTKDDEAMMKTSTTTVPPTDLVETAFTVNGEEVRLALEPRESLLDVLRERLVLTGTKKGCDQGQCGACTVHIDGRRVVSCLTLAVQVAGQDV